MTEEHERPMTTSTEYRHKIGGRQTAIVGVLLSFLIVSLFVSITNNMSIAGSSCSPQDSKDQLMQHTQAELPFFDTAYIWANVWGNVSATRIQNLTRQLSTSYSSRGWYNDQPLPSLIGAWQWANQTLKSITGGSLFFKSVTQYNTLVAVKNGTGAYPRPIVVVAGVIDTVSNTPGANDVGVSTAAVLETARVLQNYSLNYDVYYVLSSAGRLDSQYDLGARAFVQWLQEKQIPVMTTFAFGRLLFDSGSYVHGKKLSLRNIISSEYTKSMWIPQMMITLSATYGSGIVQYVTDHNVAKKSIAYEMWQLGQSAVHIAQGYWPDAISAQPADLWNHPYYSYNKAREAVACVVSVLVYIGELGAGRVAQFGHTGTLTVGNSFTDTVHMTHRGYLNCTMSWVGNTTIGAQIIRTSDAMVVYNRTESDGQINLRYLATTQGEYRIRITNTGDNNVSLGYWIRFMNDCDGDTIDDVQEIVIGASPYLVDSDFDGLSDNLELALGTDPASVDSDADGASDYDEYVSGSNLLSPDTDTDGLLDGEENTLGTSPILTDTDSDAITDYDEVRVYFTDPLDPDTDRDGLEDGFELEYGTDPRSADSDMDTLSDLFEIVNGLDPLLADTDGDGWTDAYEIEHNMYPNNPDTDGDLLPDSIDWNPREHWITVVAPATLFTTTTLLIVFSLLKYAAYRRRE